jgi:predicted transcriptional regulator
MYIKEWAELQEALLKAQLKVLRRFLKKDKKEEDKPVRKSRSKMSVVKDILEKSSTPLHVAVIINKAKSDHQTIIDRESIVSAISKKVSKGDTFIRLAPNTFGLKDKNYK